MFRANIKSCVHNKRTYSNNIEISNGNLASRNESEILAGNCIYLVSNRYFDFHFHFHFDVCAFVLMLFNYVRAASVVFLLFLFFFSLFSCHLAASLQLSGLWTLWTPRTDNRFQGWFHFYFLTVSRQL